MQSGHTECQATIETIGKTTNNAVFAPVTRFEEDDFCHFWVKYSISNGTDGAEQSVIFSPLFFNFMQSDWSRADRLTLFTLVVWRPTGGNFSTNQRFCLHFWSKPIRMRKMRHHMKQTFGNYMG
jgi:hypothetical protein